MIEAVRSGDIEVFGALYARHVTAAYNLASQFTSVPAVAEDLVAEAFADVLAILKAGRGPDSGFRPYLLTAVRHAAHPLVLQG